MMAVVQWIGDNGDKIGPRNLHPPKRADLKYWYRDARTCLVGKRVLNARVPTWDEGLRLKAVVDTETITFTLPSGTLYIARKRYL